MPNTKSILSLKVEFMDGLPREVSEFPVIPTWNLGIASGKAAEFVKQSRFDYTACKNYFAQYVPDEDALRCIIALIGMNAYEPLIKKQVMDEPEHERDFVENGLRDIVYRAILKFDPSSGTSLYTYVNSALAYEKRNTERKSELIQTPSARSLKGYKGADYVKAAARAKFVSSMEDNPSSVIGSGTWDNDLTIGDTIADGADSQPDLSYGFGEDLLNVLRTVSEIYSFEHAVACGVRCLMNDRKQSNEKSGENMFFADYCRWLALGDRLVENGFSEQDAHEAVLRTLASNRQETVNWIRQIDAGAMIGYLNALEFYLGYIPDDSERSQSTAFEYVSNVLGDLSHSRARKKYQKKRLAFCTVLQLRGYDSVARNLMAMG